MTSDGICKLRSGSGRGGAIGFCRRQLLLSLLRRRAGRIRCAFLTVYPIRCSPQEHETLQQIDPGLVVDVGNRVRYSLRTLSRIPKIHAVCVGSDGPPTRLPEVVERAVAATRIGKWNRTLQMAFLVVREGCPLRRVLVHELTHALVDSLTRGFPYPPALVEHLAMSMEFWYAMEPGTLSPKASQAPRLTSDDILSPRALLFRSAGSAIARSAEDAWHVAKASYWFGNFLASLARTFPELGRPLYEIRARGLRTPESVWLWLLAATGKSAEEFERSFRAFSAEAETRSEAT